MRESAELVVWHFRFITNLCTVNLRMEVMDWAFLFMDKCRKNLACERRMSIDTYKYICYSKTTYLGKFLTIRLSDPHMRK